MHTLLCVHVSNDELIEWALTLKSLSLFALTLLLILLLLMFSIIPDFCFIKFSIALRCLDHFAANGIRVCSLYKGWFRGKNPMKVYIMLNACGFFRFMVFDVVDICYFI